MRRAGKLHTAATQRLVRLDDIGNAKVDDGLIRQGFCTFFEEEPGPFAIEEGQLAEAIEMAQLQDIAVLGFRPLDVGHRARDLSYRP